MVRSVPILCDLLPSVSYFGCLLFVLPTCLPLRKVFQAEGLPLALAGVSTCSLLRGGLPTFFFSFSQLEPKGLLFFYYLLRTHVPFLFPRFPYDSFVPQYSSFQNYLFVVMYPYERNLHIKTKFLEHIITGAAQRENSPTNY